MVNLNNPFINKTQNMEKTSKHYYSSGQLFNNVIKKIEQLLNTKKSKEIS